MKTRGIGKWVKVTELDTQFEAQWNLQLEVDKEEAAKLKAIGLSVKTEEKEDDTLVRTIRFSRRLKKRGKKQGNNMPPKVVDAALNEYTGKIGDGSELIVLFKPYTWDNNFGKGVGADLCGVQIVNLVEYVPTEGEGAVDAIDDDDEGFEVIGEGLAGSTPKPDEDDLPF